MSTRRSAVAETRQRIVEATLRLHGAKGIFGTSWQDIAREADVSVGTVYNHFPSLDQLVPACGELLMEKARPPSYADVDAAIGEGGTPRDRLHKVARTLTLFYERGGAHLENDARERELPAVREWEEWLSALVSHGVRTALCDVAPDNEAVAFMSGLLDARTYRALRSRGLSPDIIQEQLADAATAWLSRRNR